MTERFYYSSSPVFNIDGQDVGELARDLVFLSVEESLAGLKNLQARFVALGPTEGRNRESLLYLDGRLVDFGKQLRLSIGPPDNHQVVFEGTVSALEIQFEEAQEPEFCLCAEDRLMDLRMTRRMRTYENMSDADIVSEIAQFHGLSPEIDLEGPTYDRIQQWNMSDLAFLRERARLLQADLWVEGERLFCQTRDRRSGEDITLIRGNDLIQVHIRADLAHQRSEVRVSGYDANERAVIEAVAGADAIRSEISAGRSGIDILQTAFGERRSHRIKEVPLDTVEADTWAKAELLRRARAFVTVSGMTQGTPQLRVGSRLTLEQVSGIFNGGGYYVTQVKHTYDLGQGHRTYFEAERPTVN